MSTFALNDHSFIPIDADRQIDELLAQSDAHSAKHAATVVKGPGLTVSIVALRAGASTHEHAAPGEAVLVGLRGRVKVHSKEGGSAELRPGQLVVLGAGNAHSTRAEEESAFLLTIRHAT